MENLENQNTEPQISIHLDKKESDFHSRIDMIELRDSLEKVKSEIAKVHCWSTGYDRSSFGSIIVKRSRF